MNRWRHGDQHGLTAEGVPLQIDSGPYINDKCEIVFKSYEQHRGGPRLRCPR